jgi:GNAT superfamily N-acetyltransferase
MAVEVRPYRELQPDERGEWDRLVRKAHPPGEVRLGSDLRWADLDAETDYLIQFREDDELRACAWVTRRTVTISDQEMCVAGIRGAITDPDYRRRGYGRAVMQRAHRLMRSFPDCEFALLFSSVMAVPFYETLGWRMVRESVTCEQPSGRIDYTEALPTAPVMALARANRQICHLAPFTCTVCHGDRKICLGDIPAHWPRRVGTPSSGGCDGR